MVFKFNYKKERKGKSIMNKKVISYLLVTLLIFSVCLSVGAADGKITVGSKQFTEQLILGQITVLLLEDRGFDVVDKTGLGGSSVCRLALESGEIDMYWEYTGTGWMTHLGHDNPLTDSEECYKKVKDEDENNGIIWLDYGEVNNTYTLMMRQKDANELEIKTISDLAEAINSGVESPVGNEWVFATDHEYSIRQDGLVGLEELYGFQFDDVKIMQVGITYGALKEGKVPVAMGFATDGRVEGFELVNLVDDKQFHPVYNAAPCLTEEVYDKYPELEEIFATVIPYMDDANMTKLNALVDLEGKTPEEVAKEFLMENDLI